MEQFLAHAKNLIRKVKIMIVNITKPSCYDTKKFVKKGDLLISNTSGFDLTEGRVYMATKNQGEDTIGDCIFIINDNGIEEDYSSEYLCHYEGERVSTD